MTQIAKFKVDDIVTFEWDKEIQECIITRVNYYPWGISYTMNPLNKNGYEYFEVIQDNITLKQKK